VEESFARIYSAELFYDTLPDISKPDLLAGLRQRCGRVEPLDRNEPSGLLAFVFPDHLAACADGMVPV
jgi:hypothetical protein